MIKSILAVAAIALVSALPATAQDSPAPPSPGEIAAAATEDEWVRIASEDLLVMDLAPGSQGERRRVVIQLMPAPFNQGWVANIRTLAKARWYDGISINRVQDNYVVQWGDASEKKPLPGTLATMGEVDYTVRAPNPAFANIRDRILVTARERAEAETVNNRLEQQSTELLKVRRIVPPMVIVQKDPYAGAATFEQGWPIGVAQDAVWPVHCYGMVGVGRGMSPDTGTGAELYTVIGHAPRHLDRNIALVGRVVEGIEHLSALPRGQGALGFYTEEESDKRIPLTSVRIMADLPEAEREDFEYLSTESESFARYAEARANRTDPFFIVPAGGADICNIPVPVRRADAK